MSKDSLQRLLAETTHVTESQAADKLDKAVHDIVTKLKQGQPAKLPGLGKFRPGPETKFLFSKSSKKGGSRAK